MRILDRKVLFLLVTALVAVFFWPGKTIAKSGCCSSHGGVCCSCGSQASGKVICNDGWTGSSCYYSEMVMCGGSSGGDSSYPTATPTRFYIPPIATPTRIPTTIPTIEATDTPTPTPIETVVPTVLPTETDMLTATPVEMENTPVVKGVQDQEASTKGNLDGEVLGFLATSGLGIGGFKLLMRFLKNKSKN